MNESNPRPAEKSDKQSVLDFCKNTFSWGDYIHEVWDRWIIEGNLIVIERDQIPIAMTHAAFFDDEKMLWIEGIRVNKNFRKEGLAQKMISYFENKAHSKNFKISRMLIAKNNAPSTTLAKKMGYKIISTWNYFSLESKLFPQKNFTIDKFDVPDFENFGIKSLNFVESWRWIPLVQKRIERLNSEGKILCQKVDNKINTLGILTESKSFEDTIILEIVFGTELEQMIRFVQNLAFEKNYSKVRILTELESLPLIENLENKFPFYLVQKNL